MCDINFPDKFPGRFTGEWGGKKDKCINLKI